MPCLTLQNHIYAAGTRWVSNKNYNDQIHTHIYTYENTYILRMYPWTFNSIRAFTTHTIDAFTPYRAINFNKQADDAKRDFLSKTYKPPPPLRHIAHICIHSMALQLLYVTWIWVRDHKIQSPRDDPHIRNPVVAIIRKENPGKIC